MNEGYIRYDLLDDMLDPGFESEPKTFTDRVWWIVKRLPAHFLLIDVYRHGPMLEAMFPDNRHIDASIRASLQQLREAGLIAFLDYRGSYLRIQD